MLKFKSGRSFKSFICFTVLFSASVASAHPSKKASGQEFSASSSVNLDVRGRRAFYEFIQQVVAFMPMFNRVLSQSVLNYSNCNIQNGQMFAHMGRTSPNLRVLNLHGNSDLRTLSVIDRFPHLTELNLSGTSVAMADLMDIYDEDSTALHAYFPVLERLDLSYPSFHPFSQTYSQLNRVEDLEALRSMYSLRSLNLSGRRINFRTGFSALLPLRNLRELNLSGMGLQDSDLETVKKLATLYRLNLSGNPQLSQAAIRAVWLENLDLTLVSDYGTLDARLSPVASDAMSEGKSDDESSI